MGDPNFARAYARDVALDPAVNGQNNVQDVLAGITSVTLGNGTTDVVIADTATSLTGDGNPHVVACVIAAPPSWMDNAGNITAPGLYALLPRITATAGPTTPGLAIKATGAAYAEEEIGCDVLGSSGQVVPVEVFAWAAGDVPGAAAVTVTMPTDVTEAVDVRVSVARLAY